MARPLQHHHLPIYSFSTTTTFFFLVAAVAAIFSTVLFLCTTHKHSKMRRENKDRIPGPPPSDRNLLANLSNISSKALVMAKMVSWKKGGEEEEEAVWKKSILMGDKCRPLDFSGKIVYDSEGNQLPEFPQKPPHGSSGGSIGSMKGKA